MTVSLCSLESFLEVIILLAYLQNIAIISSVDLPEYFKYKEIK